MYLPKIHVTLVDFNAMLHDENTFLDCMSIFLESLSNGTDGKDPGADLAEQEAWTTKLSGVGCLVRKPGSVGAAQYLLATDLLTAEEDTGFFQTSNTGSSSASLNGKRGSADVEVGCNTSVSKFCVASVTGKGSSRKLAAFFITA
ncbi:hypothetical protein NDU88_004156 [Pleurodeles waltl]|uniref:Uncharacterized protein n=1 Tax=Pleurodeles waltl TaxID=8319 RepID=A0AAV7QC49_PLEWA|nr:hypothetical protein NDU88_004156 [Pleurodeles waltl]